MKVESVDAWVVEVPYIAPVRQVGWSNPPFVVIRVRTDDGLSGLGGAWGADKTATERVAQAFVGKEPLAFELQSLEAPFQSAFYDLAGQALGVPVWRLIGDRQRERTAVAYWSCHMPPVETGREAERAAARGFRVHKLKARSWDIVQQTHADVARVYSVLGADDRLAVDLHAGGHEFSGRVAFDWFACWLGTATDSVTG